MIKICKVEVTELYEFRWKVLRPNEQNTQNVHYPGDEGSNSIHLKAFNEIGIVGCVSAIYETPPFNKPYCNAYRLRALAVSPSFRGMGLGRKLVLYLEDEICQKSRICWLSGRTNLIEFYEHLGYKKVGDEFNITGTGPHSYMMKHLLCNLQVEKGLDEI